jgi:hypothetical protein
VTVPFCCSPLERDIAIYDAGDVQYCIKNLFNYCFCITVTANQCRSMFVSEIGAKGSVFASCLRQMHSLQLKYDELRLMK